MLKVIRKDNELKVSFWHNFAKKCQKKQKIAKKIVHMLQDGDLIFLDISTTNIEVAKLLKTAGKKQVRTH